MELNEQQAAKIMTAASLMLRERERQVKTGRTQERDALYVGAELSRAAAAYATPQGYRRHNGDGVPTMYPWHPSTFKPEPQTYEGRLVELAKAGALILADMERIIAKRDAEVERRGE
ncbi:hypothetical protein [Bradyrhizobium yuanmingense]|uniref:hypothetical protein n=1 Tax=Bradyrhizobium yuanmingense TaxID=108015 RepID=UPI0004B8A7FD|nr:hypothetical protein [Bradyrhizobium yuanmingense]